MSICLTASQKESYDFIQKYYKKNNVLPTLSEIAADAGCTVPGIAYRVAAGFLKGAYGHNANTRLHNIVEAEPLVKQPVKVNVDWNDESSPFIADKELISRIVFKFINNPSAAHHMNTSPYTAFELVYSKSGKRGPLYRWLTKAAKDKAWNHDMKPVHYVLDVIGDMIAEGKIFSDREDDTFDSDSLFGTHRFSYDHETEERHLAAEKAEREEQACIEAEQAAKTSSENVLATALLELLKSSPKFNEIAAVLRG